MSKKNYDHIYYRNCPHFTVGRVDQWGERGYLLYEGMVYEYHEDRKCQYGETLNPRTKDDFLAYSNDNKIKIPAVFLDLLDELK